MYIKILVVILSMFILSPVNAADINYDAIVVLKDIGTSTPDGDTENPRTIDDAIRRNSRLLEIAYHEKLLTSNGTVTTADTYIIGSSSTAILVSFPSASSCANGTTTKVFVVKNIGAGTMTLSPTIDGVGSPTVSQKQAMTIFTDGTRWMEVRAKNSALATRATDADNADLLNSQAGSYYRDASNLNAGEIPLARLPSTLTGKDADTLDGQEGSYYQSSTNQNAGTLPLARLPTTLTGKDADTLDTIDSTGFVQVDTTYLKSWKVGSDIGTGTFEILPGPGISITGTVTNGVGNLTITGVGTTTAGGFLDTGTQSVLTSGYQLNLNGGAIVGITDDQIPGTITLDNITQVTARDLVNMQGMIGLGTQSNYRDIIKWRSNGKAGTGTINLVFSGNGTLSTTYSGSLGEGTATVNIPTCFGNSWRTTSYEIAANNTWYNLGLDGTSSAFGVTFGTATMAVDSAGTYLVSGNVSFRDCVTGIVRIVKNWGTEVKGTVASGNTSNVTWITVTVPPTIVSLAVNDTIGLQVGCDITAGTPEVDFIGSATLPDPTTTIYATLSLVRIGN